jgi:2'-5' RNA ligase
VRLFVAVWPPPDVAARLAALPRPELPGLRWTTRDQWHVTLLFLGERPDEEVAPLGAGVAAVAAGQPDRPVARLGPRTTILSGAALVVPVAGLDALAAPLHRVLGPGADGARPFRGHLTLARARGRRRVDSRLAGTPLEAVWTVDRVALVASTLGADGARYRTLAAPAVGRSG